MIVPKLQVIGISMESEAQSSNLSLIKISESVGGAKKVMHSIERGRESRFYFEKVLNFDYCLLLFSIMSIVLSELYYDADYVGKTRIAESCLILILVILVIEMVVTFFRYKAQVELEKAQRILDEQEGIHSSGKTWQIVMEMFILLFQPYYFLNDITIQTEDVYDGFFFDFKVNYVLVVLSFTKIFIILRVVLLRQIYMSPRSSRLCRMYGCESDYLYAIKCLFKDTPLSLIGIVFACSILIFSISLRIAERNLVIEYPRHFNGQAYPGNIERFENALWLTIITMTTVGYGDFFPRTIFGRLIDILLVVWGTFIVSLMVVVLTNTLNMDQSEKRALIVLNRLEAKKTLKEASAFVITHSCKKYLLQKRIARNQRPPLTEEEHTKMQSTFYKYLSNFQNVHRDIRQMYEIDDVYEEMTRQFEFINDEVNVLLKSQEDTIINITGYIQEEQQKANNPKKGARS